MHLDAQFVNHWSNRYVHEELSTLERDLLSTTHEAITERGYLTSDELSKIVTWKSQRTLGVLKRDPDIATRDDTIRDATRVALARETPEWMKHRILCFLYGVGHPVASAILTIWDPDNHTVIDVRTVGALRKLWELGLLDAEPPSRTDRYLKYLRVFRDITKELVVGHRDLDRALWKWHREGMPETWPDTDAT